MIKHTSNLGQRAEDIAKREAEKVWKLTHNFSEYCKKFYDTYNEVLIEFCYQPLEDKREYESRSFRFVPLEKKFVCRVS